MNATGVDIFRRRVFEAKFRITGEVDAEAHKLLKESGDTLVLTSSDRLEDVFFNAPATGRKESAQPGAITRVGRRSEPSDFRQFGKI